MIAGFDIGGGTVQSGFAQITGNGSATDNGVTLTMAGAGGVRTRTLEAVDVGHPYADVLSDTAFSNGTMTFDFTGLDANTDYAVTVFMLDADFNNIDEADWYLGSPTTGTFLYNWKNDSLTLRDGVDIRDVSATADGSGAITLSAQHVGGSNGIRANGFIVTVIPEPASMALLGVGGLLIAGRGRRVS